MPSLETACAAFVAELRRLCENEERSLDYIGVCGGEGVSQITLFNNEKIPSIRTSHNISHKMTFGLPRPSAVSEE